MSSTNIGSSFTETYEQAITEGKTPDEISNLLTELRN